MNRIQEIEHRLNLAFTKSGMTPEEFFDYIVETRHPLRVNKERLQFEVELGDYEIEWFIYHHQTKQWVMG